MTLLAIDAEERDVLNLILDLEDEEILVEAPADLIYNGLSLDKNDSTALLSFLPLDLMGVVAGNCLTSFRYNISQLSYAVSHLIVQEFFNYWIVFISFS